MSPGLRARLEVFGAALLFSTGGALVKSVALPAAQVACWRAGIAALGLLLLPGARRGWRGSTWLVGLSYAATGLLFVHANKLTTAADAIFLQATSPLYVLLLAPLLLREPVRRLDVVFMLVLGGGLALFFVGGEATQQSAPQPLLGNALAALTGLSSGLMMLGLRWLGRGGGAAEPAAIAGNLLIFGLQLPLALPTHGRPQDFLLLLYMGLVQVGGGYALLMRSLRQLSAVEATLLLFFEPVLSPLWAFLLHGERPGPWSLVGAATIAAGTVLRALIDLRRQRRAGEPASRPA